MPQEPQTSPGSLVGEEYEVEVGPVAHGGHCVARTEAGRVLFVRHTLPGERVVARVTHGDETSRFLRADAVEILDAAKDRVPAPCPYAYPGRCGGCDWQHAKPGAQRRLKGEVIAEQLQHLAGLTPEQAGWDGTVAPAPGDKLPAGAEVPAWRTRVQYAIDADGRAGLRRHRSHEVEPVEHCMIAAEGVSELGIEQRDWSGMESVEAIAASGSGDRQVVLTPRPGARLPLVELDRPVSVLRVDERDGGVHRVHGRAFVRERADDHTWRVGNGGFWQVHPKAADTLVEAVMQGLLPRKGDTALDLYCGVGLFAGALADRVGDKGAVLGIEVTKRAVEDARHNLKDFDRVRVEQGKVEQVLPRTGITETDLIVLDPPRAGRQADGGPAVLAGSQADRVRGLRPGGTGPGLGVLPRGRIPGAGDAGVRSVSDDASCGVRGDSGARGQELLTEGSSRWSDRSGNVEPGGELRAERLVFQGFRSCCVPG